MNFVGLALDDVRWSQFLGGYRVPYDPRRAFQSLEREENVEEAWKELATELCHQGDVGEASYATVPHLVRIHEQRGVPDWNTYALVAMIEEGRQARQKPVLPNDLQDAYDDAWQKLVLIGLRELEMANEPLLVSCIIAVVAMGKGQYLLGQFALLFDEAERERVLKNAAWSSPYQSVVRPSRDAYAGHAFVAEPRQKLDCTARAEPCILTACCQLSTVAGNNVGGTPSSAG